VVHEASVRRVNDETAPRAAKVRRPAKPR
jgi:hypothetical protein